MSVKSWFDDLDLSIQIVLTVVLIILYPIGIIFFSIYFISWYIDSNKPRSLKPIIEKLQQQIEKKEKLKKSKSILTLNKDEKLLYCQSSDYHCGGSNDSGILLVTSKRFIFQGNIKNYIYNRNKIINIEQFSDAIKIAIEGRKNQLIFTSNNPLLLGATIEILQGNLTLNPYTKESLENELKTKILEKIKILEGDLSFNVETYKDLTLIFASLYQCICLDMEEYANLYEISKEIIILKSKIESFTKIFNTYNKELENIKIKLGNSVKKEKLQTELDNIIDTKYNFPTITNSILELVRAVNSISPGKITITVKNNKKDF